MLTAMIARPTIDALALPADALLAHPGIHKQPFVSEDADGKSMHFTIMELQSRMLKSSPWSLDVDYTRTMMGFLLLKPQPAHIGMVGLGGGSIAKFCHRHLAASHLTVLEINPHVIALRAEFCVPDDDQRLQVIEADGAAFTARQTGRFDALLIDGFDHSGQPADLCSQAFYDDCHTALKGGGVLAVNLHYDSEDYPLWLTRIERSFGGNAVEIPAIEKSNCIVFASRGPALSPRKLNLSAGLAGLDAVARQQLKAEFSRILWTMKDLSEVDDAPS